MAHRRVFCNARHPAGRRCRSLSTLPTERTQWGCRGHRERSQRCHGWHAPRGGQRRPHSGTTERHGNASARRLSGECSCTPCHLPVLWPMLRPNLSIRWVRPCVCARALALLALPLGNTQLSDFTSPLRPGQAHEAHRDPDHPLAADNSAGGSPPTPTASAPSTPLHCPGGDESSTIRLVGSALLQEKTTQEAQEGPKEQLRPMGELPGGAEREFADESAPGNCTPAKGAPCSGSAPAALPEICGGGQMSEAERRSAAERLESELRWTEAALQSRVRHLIGTHKDGQVSPSATR